MLRRSLLLLLHRRRDAVERQHAEHVPDGNARLTRLDPCDRLDMNAQARGSGRLALASRCARQLGSSTERFDRLDRVVSDVGRNSFSLGHGVIVSAPGEGR